MHGPNWCGLGDSKLGASAIEGLQVKLVRRPDPLPIQRPTWLPNYLPELQGLRGIAILAVVLYHCHPRLEGTWIYRASLWGWAGVIIFFALSGFLITSNLLGSLNNPHYMHKFHANRVLRIVPLYVLVLTVCYWQAPWFIGPSTWDAVKAAPWLAYIFFVQNLFHLALPPAIAPTWALAIEEQYYFLWAPAVRFLRRPWILTVLLVLALIVSPLLRHSHYAWLTPTHTLIHLDGIALGSLMAVGLYTIPLARRIWFWMGLSGLALGDNALLFWPVLRRVRIAGPKPSNSPPACWNRGRLSSRTAAIASGKPTATAASSAAAMYRDHGLYRSGRTRRSPARSTAASKPAPVRGRSRCRRRPPSVRASAPPARSPR